MANKLIRQQPPLKAAATKPGKVLRWRIPGLCLVLAAITFAVFGQTLHHEFVDFDDYVYLTSNPMVVQGLTFKGIVWAFTHYHAFNWHPLTVLSHMLDCQLYGLNPAGHHLTNVLLHTATVIALFLVLRQMTGALWRSAFVAAVFAIHPLRVESVAWVAERKDVLSGFFFMLTIAAYVRYARRPWSWGRYGLVVLLFAMGLMSKPMLVTLPLVLLFLDYWPLQRKEAARRLMLEKLPLLALSIISCVATLGAQSGVVRSSASFSLPERLGNALTTCMVYLGQMVWPAGLAVYYPYPHNGLPSWEVALAGTLLVALSMLAFWQRRKQPWLWVGWFWYLVMLLPVAGFIQVGAQAHADRYTYLPQIGIYVALTWLVAQWRVSRVVLGGLMIGTLAVLMFCAWQQTAYWKNSETLWTRALACTTNNDVAEGSFGLILFHKGEVDEAIARFQQALQISPDYPGAHNNLGIALLQKKEVNEAITQFQQALQYEPDFLDACVNLGNALRQVGRMDEAIDYYQKALQINPDSPAAHNSLGSAFLQKGKVDEAISHFEQALRTRPDFADAHYNLGIALYQKGKPDEAIAHYKKVLEIEPASVKAHNNMGVILFNMGRADEAIRHFQAALQIEPDNPAIQNSLAWLLATCPQASLRNGGEAVKLAQQANELTGGKDPVILHTLAAALAEAGRFSDAMQSAQKALELARAAGRQGLAKQLDDELKRYEAGAPLHQ